MNGLDATGGDSDEEAVWRDLVARFEADGEPGATPWPERENLRTSVHGEQAPGQDKPRPSPEPGPAGHSPEPGTAGHSPAAGAAGLAGDDLTGDPGGSGAGWLDRPVFPGEDVPLPAGPAPVPPDGADPAAENGDHFIPPPPPPLPRLKPVVKGAWLALFGGPLYLLVATGAGWTVPGWTAFCAMAAFVAGFVVLVLHLGNDRHSDGPGSDDGAVL